MDEMQALRTMTLERLMPLGSALSESKAPALRRAGEWMRGDGALTPEEAWRKAAAAEKQPGGSLEELGNEELNEIANLFTALSALSRHEQGERYAQTIARLGHLEEEKRAAGREKRKLCASLGALTGLAASVMLM